MKICLLLGYMSLVFVCCSLIVNIFSYDDYKGYILMALGITCICFSYLSFIKEFKRK